MAEKSFEHWGHLRARFAEPRPRKILALDGGGIRGVLTLEVLVKIEQLLREKLQKPELVLADYFDYIAGTSTGGIIAAALAIGMDAKAVRDLYLRVGQETFKKQSLLERLNSAYQGGPLEQILKQTFGHQRSLAPADLRTLLLIVTRNTTTDSAWPISSNPDAKYNAVGRDYCNLGFPLWQVVRASTAAPTYFPPEIIAMQGAKGEQKFVFVDGGTTAYNNPAFLAYKMVTEPRYKLGWRHGEKELLIVSVGTGGHPVEGQTAEDPELNVLANAVHTLRSVMNQAQVDQDMSCRMIGRCSYGKWLDREVHDLVPVDAAEKPIPLDTGLGRAFLYARYDVDLTVEGLLALGLGGLDPVPLRALDALAVIPQLRQVGYQLAERVKLAHFGSFV
jgi:uncharacterized protein